MELEKLPYEKILTDPIHDYVQINYKVIMDLINTKEFQRLRHIKQLGTLSFIFHGAEHTRFGHSLGVYEITRRIIEFFNRNYPKSKFKEDGWDSQEDIVALCAALLHDIGHGAYSHTFEHLFNTNHEEISVQIILSENTEIHKILSNCDKTLPQKVAEVIQKKYHNPQVIQLISSQADADRMDYLLRDAYFTGTNYGLYDLSRILYVIKPYKDGICFKESGMHAVEDYITSRYQMFNQVYFHPVSRGMESVLANTLKRAKDIYPNNKEFFHINSKFLVPFFEDNYSLDDYLQLDDYTLYTYVKQWISSSDPILKDLSQAFINRKPFKAIQLTNDIDLRQLKTLKSLLLKLGFDPEYYSTVNSAEDLPYDIYRARKHSPKTQIEIMAKDNSLFELSTKSTIVKALSGQITTDKQFFIPKNIIKNNSKLNQEYVEEFNSYIYNNKYRPK